MKTLEDMKSQMEKTFDETAQTQPTIQQAMKNRVVAFFLDRPFWSTSQVTRTSSMDMAEVTAAIRMARKKIIGTSGPILEKINRYLPKMEYIYAATRVTDIRNKSVEQLRSLKEMGLREISLGVESGDDWTLERINKGYHAEDIIEQCAKLTEAGVDFWMSFLNGVAGKEHSMDHAVHSAEIFSQCNPMLVGTGGLVLFPGMPLLEDAKKGEFTPLSEMEMLLELKTFVEHLTCDCTFITHHTVSGRNLTGPNFLQRKDKIVAALDHEIRHGDMDRMAAVRRGKRTL